MAKALRKAKIPFWRQVAVGHFNVDFMLRDARTVIEVDGCYWHKCARCGYADGPRLRKALKAWSYAHKRNAYLASRGLIVIHIPQHDIKELGAIEAIRVGLLRVQVETTEHTG